MKNITTSKLEQCNLNGVNHFYSGVDFYVSQLEKYGCAMACMAMILNVKYEDVKKLWDMKYGTIEGVSDYMQASFLFSKGIVSFTTYQTEAWTQKKREPNEWIKSFAPVHIVTVITSLGVHALVWLNDGRVYDPNIRGVYSIKDYNVQSITGYWALNNFGK